MKDSFFIALLLILFTTSFMYFLYYLWFVRPRLLNEKIIGYFKSYKGIDSNKFVNESKYIEIESSNITSSIKYKKLDICLMHFGLAGTFRKKFYFVLAFDDKYNPSGIYGRGHIFREVTSRIHGIKTFKVFEYKFPDSFEYSLSNYEAVEVNNGRAFLFFHVSSAIGYVSIKKVAESIIK